METYNEMKANHQKRVNDFEGLIFAFSNKQMEESLSKIGLSLDDAKGRIVSIGAGAYLLKERVKAFHDLIDQNEKELKAFRKDQKQLIEGLVYELGNHEYCITGDPQDAVEKLGYTMETIPRETLTKAIKKYNRNLEGTN